MKKLKKLKLSELETECFGIEKLEMQQIFGGSGPDWYSASDSVKITTILNAYANGQNSSLDSLFDNVGGTAYTSNPNGTNVTLNGQSYNMVMIVGNFDDNYTNYGYETRDRFSNPYGTWDPINIGNNGVLRILIKASDNNVGSFTNFLNGGSY